MRFLAEMGVDQRVARWLGSRGHDVQAVLEEEVTEVLSEPPDASILLYHSISEGTGPTCIAPAVFRAQMAALAELGYRGTSLAAWLRGEAAPAGRPVVLTFDDAFGDFAEAALPELTRHGFGATVFVPAGKVGGTGDWEPARRPLMGWAALTALGRAGVEVGAHGVTHADLTALPADAAHEEITGSRRRLEDGTGAPVTSFAPPYGRSTPALRCEIARHFSAAVGTRMARARRDADPYDLPRIDMWYFRDARRWRAYLARGTTAYFTVRRVLRGLRALAGS